MMPQQPRPESSRSSRGEDAGESRWKSEGWTAVSPLVLRIARGVHVVPGPLGGWELRTLGSERMRQRFATFSEALSAALAVQREQVEQTDVIVHHRSQGCRVIKVLEAEPTSRHDGD